MAPVRCRVHGSGPQVEKSRSIWSEITGHAAVAGSIIPPVVHAFDRHVDGVVSCVTSRALVVAAHRRAARPVSDSPCTRTWRTPNGNNAAGELDLYRSGWSSNPPPMNCATALLPSPSSAPRRRSTTPASDTAASGCTPGAFPDAWASTRLRAASPQGETTTRRVPARDDLRRIDVGQTGHLVERGGDIVQRGGPTATPAEWSGPAVLDVPRRPSP